MELGPLGIGRDWGSPRPFLLYMYVVLFLRCLLWESPSFLGQSPRRVGSVTCCHSPPSPAQVCGGRSENVEGVPGWMRGPAIEGGLLDLGRSPRALGERPLHSFPLSKSCPCIQDTRSMKS